MKKQTGFTAIELMVTLLIVSVLAMISLPIYKDFMLKARITEAYARAATYKALVVENAVNGKAFNAGHTSLGASSFTDSMEGVTILQTNGTISVKIKSKYNGNGPGGPGGSTITLQPLNNGLPLVTGVIPTGRLTWNCKGGTALQKLRPANCRTGG